MFLQWSIGLFEVGLLNFQSRFRRLKRTALACQLLIGCSQLFALRLKLFGLLLGFLKQFLQAYPIFRRSHSNADRFGHAFQKLGMRIVDAVGITQRSEEHTSELQSLMRISYAVFCLQNKITTTHTYDIIRTNCTTNTPN